DPANKQDATLLTSKYQNGVLSFVFSRPIRVCMGHNDTDFDIKEADTFVIWAYGTVNRNDIQYHGSTDRGVVDLNFLTEAPVKRTLTRSEMLRAPVSSFPTTTEEEDESTPSSS